MVGVVKLVDTPDCDSGLCGFKSRRSPQFNTHAEGYGPENPNLGEDGSSPFVGTKG